MDDFEFGDDLNRFFSSTHGVGSRITEKDEAKKRQLTVAKRERELLLKYHKDIPIGALSLAETREQKTRFSFRRFPDGKPIELRVNFPKPGKNELRLYFNEKLFSPVAGDKWFLFERDGELWIGSLEDSELEAAKNGATIDVQNGFDQANEEIYQEAANAHRPELVTTSTTRYRRDPNIAIRALEQSDYQCEMLPRMQTFQSRVTSHPYLEAHHLVPMMEQRNFTENLDVIDNICILNPYAHKMLHHATYGEIEPFLEKLVEPRAGFLKDIGVSVERVMRSYGKP